MGFRRGVIAALLMAVPVVATTAASAGTLDTIRIAYRNDARPSPKRSSTPRNRQVT